MFEAFLPYLGAFILAPALLWVAGKYIPNNKLAVWGVKHGRAISRKASATALGKDAWEKIEDTFLGGLVAYVTALKKGADMDD